MLSVSFESLFNSKIKRFYLRSLSTPFIYLFIYLFVLYLFIYLFVFVLIYVYVASENLVINSE